MHSFNLAAQLMSSRRNIEVKHDILIFTFPGGTSKCVLHDLVLNNHRLGEENTMTFYILALNRDLENKHQMVLAVFVLPVEFFIQCQIIIVNFHFLGDGLSSLRILLCHVPTDWLQKRQNSNQPVLLQITVLVK